MTNRYLKLGLSAYLPDLCTGVELSQHTEQTSEGDGLTPEQKVVVATNAVATFQANDPTVLITLSGLNCDGTVIKTRELYLSTSEWQALYGLVAPPLDQQER
jgi:hypothetical protein